MFGPDRNVWAEATTQVAHRIDDAKAKPSNRKKAADFISVSVFVFAALFTEPKTADGN